MITVYLTDEHISYDAAIVQFESAAQWAREYCPSFIGYHVVDVSDFSYTCDQITEYRFSDARDVLMFKLRWS